MSHIRGIPTHHSTFLLVILYMATSYMLIPKMDLQHLVWKTSNLRSNSFLKAQFSHPQSRRLTTMDLYNEAFRCTGKYGEEKISGRMEPKAELALFNLFLICLIPPIQIIEERKGNGNGRSTWEIRRSDIC